MSTFMDRRLFFAGCGGLLLAGQSLGRTRRIPLDERRFLVKVYIPGGVDQALTVDARKLALTEAALVPNYTDSEPSVWMGRNGNSCLYQPSILGPLHKRLKDISILNGVHMERSFDGHEQNVNTLFTGQPFGGSFYANRPGLGIDAFLLGTLENITLDSQLFQVHAQAAETGKLLRSISQGTSYVERLGGCQDPKAMDAQLSDYCKETSGLAALRTRLRLMKIPAPTQDDQQAWKIMASAFRADITRNAILVIKKYDFDTHDTYKATAQLRFLTETFAEVDRLITFLKNEPFDAGRSIYDVTTLMVASEFGRAVGRRGADKTGSDHNTFANSILLAGGNIKGGHVIGRTDLHTVDEFKGQRSVEHKRIDPETRKAIGFGVDYKDQCRVVNAPGGGRKLTYRNVINTVLESLHCPQDMKTVDQSGSIEPALSLLV